MVIKPSKYLILTDDKWFTYNSIEDIWEHFITNTSVEYIGIEIAFMHTVQMDNVYVQIRAIDDIDKLKSFCERILWGE